MQRPSHPGVKAVYTLDMGRVGEASGVRWCEGTIARLVSLSLTEVVQLSHSSLGGEST